MKSGKPVSYVGLGSWEHENRPLKTLIIPEGVIKLGYLDSTNLAEISLPGSLTAIDGNGYSCTFVDRAGGLGLFYSALFPYISILAWITIPVQHGAE